MALTPSNSLLSDKVTKADDQTDCINISTHNMNVWETKQKIIAIDAKLQNKNSTNYCYVVNVRCNLFCTISACIHNITLCKSTTGTTNNNVMCTHDMSDSWATNKNTQTCITCRACMLPAAQLRHYHNSSHELNLLSTPAHTARFIRLR